MSEVIVVGAGVSGIAACHYLKSSGIEPLLLERDDVLGGRLGLCTVERQPMQCGGKNIGRRYTFFRRFAASLGQTAYEHHGLNVSRVRNGKLVTTDGEKPWRAAKNLIASGTPRDAWRFFRLARRVAKDDADAFIDSPYFNALSGRYGHAALSGYFSPEFCDRVIRPMVVIMNGAEPDEAYLGNFGSNLRNLLDTYEQVPDSMLSLLEKATRGIAIELETTVESLIVQKNRVTGVTVADRSGRARRIGCDAVIVATPAPAAAELLRPVAPLAADALARVRYFPVAMIMAGYDREVFGPSVRSLVFDTGMPVSNAAAYGVNRLDVVRYTLSGRAARGCLDGRHEPEALLDMAEQCLNRHIRVPMRERAFVLHRVFDPGLCAYTPDQVDFMGQLRAGQDKVGGVYLTGDYMKGASIEACFRAAEGTVRCLANHLAGRMIDERERSADQAGVPQL